MSRMGWLGTLLYISCLWPVLMKHCCLSWGTVHFHGITQTNAMSELVGTWRPSADTQYGPGTCLRFVSWKVRSRPAGRTLSHCSPAQHTNPGNSSGVYCGTKLGPWPSIQWSCVGDTLSLGKNTFIHGRATALCESAEWSWVMALSTCKVHSSSTCDKRWKMADIWGKCAGKADELSLISQ